VLRLKRVALAVISCAALAGLALAQTPPPRPTPGRGPLVIQGGVELVQVDAVVTDGKGKHVTDLTAADFQVMEDGRPQTISHCQYVVMEPSAATEMPAPAAVPKEAPLRREDVRRAMAVVVDDLGISFEDINGVRDGLKKFVEKDLNPGDIMSIVRASGGMGILQQFTGDKDLLRAAASQVRYNGLAGSGATASEAAAALGEDPTGLAESVEGLKRQALMFGTLGAMEYAIEELRSLPGRRSMLVFSSILSLRDHFSVGDTDGMPKYAKEIDPRAVEALQRVTDLANRASVVIYTVDPRGLQIVGPTGADVQAHMNNRQETQAGLDVLAKETGGLFMRGGNDMNWAVKQVVADQRGYYLLGYVPDAEAVQAAAKRAGADHRLKVEVKRPGLHVRYRSKYSGSLEPEPTPPPTEGDQILSSLTSPFTRSDLAVRMTPVLLRDADNGYVVRTFLHVDGKGLTVENGAKEGIRKVRVELASTTFGDKGVLGDQAASEITFPFPASREPSLKDAGLVLEMKLPVKKAGLYQMRSIVRDAPSKRQGSARAFLNVPQVKKDRLALSGVVVQGAATDDDPQSSAAVRHFKPGSDVLYAFMVYGAKGDMKASKPAVDSELKLYRDNQVVSSGKAQLVASPPPAAPKPDPRAAKGKNAKPPAKEPEGQMLLGSFHLSSSIEPGAYALEVRAIDPLAKEPFNAAAQTIDFDVVGASAASTAP
jgi:VWFA-related protein